MKKALSLILALCLLLTALPVLSDAPLSLDLLMEEIDGQAKAMTVGPLTFEISPDRQSIYIDRPEITGTGDYTIAYNIYDADSNPVNYFFSNEARVAATPGYGGLFNVFVVVTDRVSGKVETQNIGWQELSWPRSNLLTVGKLSYEISSDQKAIFIDRPQISCASGSVSIAYNIYDSSSNPVNYFYSTVKRVAAAPGRDGKFNVFVVVTDTVTGEQNIQDIGWVVLGNPDNPYSEENVRARMLAMKAEYPEGMPWTNNNSYVIRLPNMTYYGYGCVAFAYILSDAAFKGLPLRNKQVFTYEELRVGDMLRINNDTHHVIILEKYSDHVVIAEGNYNRSIHWGRTLTKDKVMASDYMTTRYPD